MPVSGLLEGGVQRLCYIAPGLPGVWLYPRQAGGYIPKLFAHPSARLDAQPQSIYHHPHRSAEDTPRMTKSSSVPRIAETLMQEQERCASAQTTENPAAPA